MQITSGFYSYILDLSIFYTILAIAASFFPNPFTLLKMFGGPSFTPNDLPDLTGRIILVTGGGTGLGKESILAFARKGAKVYMAARSESRAVFPPPPLVII